MTIHAEIKGCASSNLISLFFFVGGGVPFAIKSNVKKLVVYICLTLMD